MKRTVTIFCLITVAFVANAQTKFYDGTWKEAYKEAEKENKLLFVDCYTDWCYWCKVAEKNTFPDAEVGKILNDNFISVQTDMERGEGIDLGMKYRVMGYPTYLVFNSDGTLAAKMVGHIEENADFVTAIKKLLEGETINGYPSKITDDVKFPEFYRKAFKNADVEKQKREFPEVSEVDKWLGNQTDLTAENAWSVFFKFSSGEKMEGLFLENQKEFIKRYGSAEVQDKLVSIANEKLKGALKSLDMKELDLALQFAFKYLDQDQDDLKSQYFLKFYEAKEDWVSYAERAQMIIDKAGFEKNLDMVNSFSWSIYLHASDKDVLTLAKDWMTKVVEAEVNYFYLDTYAALLYKCGLYTQALSMAEKAIFIGKEEEVNVDETVALQEKIVAAMDEK